MLRLFRIDPRQKANEQREQAKLESSMNMSISATQESANTIGLSPKMKKRFLVIEDESDIANLLALHLKDLNADVAIASNGSEGLQLALNENWDAILLDLQLPEMDGLDLCREIRANASFVPVMMLTSRSTELDRVLGLEIGADDYMVKPFSIPELKARVKALLRRASQSANAPAASPKDVSINGFVLDESARKASLNGEVLDLTAKEFDLLWFFTTQPGVVFKRAELLDKVWGYGHEGYEHTVNSHINRLRAKLEKDPAKPEHIQTVWGVGYRFGN